MLKLLKHTKHLNTNKRINLLSSLYFNFTTPSTLIKKPCLSINHQHKSYYSQKKNKYTSDLFEYDDLIEDFTNTGTSELETKLALSTELDFIKSFQGLNDEMDSNIKMISNAFENENMSLLDKQQQIFGLYIYALQFEVMGIAKEQDSYIKFVLGFLTNKQNDIKSSTLLNYLSDIENGNDDKTMGKFCFFAKKMVDYLESLEKKQKQSGDFMFLIKNKYDVKSLFAVLEALEMGYDFALYLKNKGLFLIFELLFSFTTKNGEKLVVDPINQLKYLETLKFLKKDREVIQYLKKTQETIDQKWWHERYLQELVTSKENKDESMKDFEPEFKKHLEKYNNAQNSMIPLLFFSSVFNKVLTENDKESFDIYFNEFTKMLENHTEFKLTTEKKAPENISVFETEKEFFDFFNNNVTITLSDYLICISETIKSDPDNTLVIKKFVTLLKKYRSDDILSNSAYKNLELLLEMNDSLDKLETDNTETNILDTMVKVSDYLCNLKSSELEPYSNHLLKRYFITNCMKLLKFEPYNKEIDALLVKTLEFEEKLTQ
ncbi:hypothetical protein HANVADRAFT_51896 [Hanseniaspora valbyensis NRRL Y-1626]|uniref:Uncharacterized protein n=1 Tax=Hanseniaspora valbyensis NRRL Y-1626 TaxID=766949 RepID=A0A1B7TGA7_9ASCO|nr:hypothetical protein HANVADRAFT_51896 [Hanseniaspora valbyensis NRRL Y-1626]